MLEGFSETYLTQKNTPFMFELASQGSHVKLDPMFAFRGIEATIFSGLHPNQHGIWTEFCLSDSVIREYKNGKTTHFDSQYNVLDNFDSLFDDKTRRVIRYCLQKAFKHDNVQMGSLMPLGALNLFEPSLMDYIYRENVLPSIPTLFDKLRAVGQSFTYFEPPLFGGYDVLNALEHATKKFPDNLFWYFKLCDPDLFGHKFGPHSEEIKRCSSRLDAIVNEFIKKMDHKFHDFSIVIMSAHGMCSVKGTINLQEHLKRVAVKPYRDYILFLDSTMARFWFSNDAVEYKIRDALENIAHGHILSDYEMNMLNIPHNLKYGELVFVIDEGYIIHPSYFHASQLPRGMHGFAYGKSPDVYSPFIVYGSDSFEVSKNLPYSEVFSILSKLLDLNGDS